MRTGIGVPGGRRWFLVAGAAAVVVLGGTGAALLTFSPAPVGRVVADGCGLVACGTSLPRSVTGLAAGGTPQRHDPARPPSPKPAPGAASHTSPPDPAPLGHHRLPPSPAPSPTWHSRAPQVTVTYTLDDDQNQQQGFRARLTIVNNGYQAIAGWTIELSLPGDKISWVGYPGTPQPFAVWQRSGHFLVLHAASGGETLPPGGTEIVQLSADGPRTAPTGCTFNGADCRA